MGDGKTVARVSWGKYLDQINTGTPPNPNANINQTYAWNDLNGDLNFQPGDELKPEKRQKVFIKPYSVVAPRANEFHQHFNTAKGPLRQLAFKGWVRRPLGTNSKGEYDSVGAAQWDRNRGDRLL